MPTLKRFMGDVLILGNAHFVGAVTGDSTFPGGGEGGAVTSVAGRTGAVVLVESDIANLTTDLAGKSATSHNHDASYFTESEVTSLLAGKSDSGHSHGGGAVITEVEIDFGAVPTWATRFTISDAAITPTTKILVQQSGRTPTGGFGDESELDPLDLIAVPGSGSMLLTATPLAGRVLGKFRLNYQIGA